MIDTTVVHWQITDRDGQKLPRRFDRRSDAMRLVQMLNHSGGPYLVRGYNAVNKLVEE